MKKILTFILVIGFAFLSVVYFGGCKQKVKRSAYNITLRYDENTRLLVGTSEFTFYNDTDNTFSELLFNLFPNAYRKEAKYPAYSDEHKSSLFYDGVNYGNIEIERVYNDKSELTFKISGEDKNVLTVNLSKDVFPNESTKVKIDYTVKVAKINHRLGVCEKSVNLANFYPILCVYEEGKGFYECVYYNVGDPFYSDLADYTVSLTCSSKYVIASSGKIVSSTQNGEEKTEKFTASGLRDFALCLSQHFDILSEKVGNVCVNYYYYNDNSPKDSLSMAVKSIKTFNNLFGCYENPTLSVVETGFYQGGMEFPALVYISDSLDKNSYLEVICHETAHQWWYGAVGNNEIEESFLDEGLTEYSVVLFYENNPEYNLKREDLINSATKTFRTFCSVYDKIFSTVNTAMNRALNEYKSEYEYVNVVYVKGCIFFDDLRTFCKDEAFFSSLKTYYSAYKNKNANTEDLISVFEKTTPSISSFFEGYLSGKTVI